MEIELLYGDAGLAVFDKPSGLLVHRGWGDDAVTLVDLARERLGGAIHPVHRIDRATSGVVVIARSPAIAASVQAMFERGEVDKIYLALVRGIPPEEGVVDHPIPRREGGPRVPAVTSFRRAFAVNAESAPDLPPDVQRCALVEARPRTGRLHQVRRHLKHIHHPLIGDANYGKGDLNRLFRAVIGLGRLGLHAAELAMKHPATGEPMRFRARVPEDLATPLDRLGIPRSAYSLMTF
jgi:tRNA pseudouridine65 synthase